MTMLITPQARAPKARFRLGWFITLLFLLCIPVIYFVQQQVDTDTLVYILTGYIVLIFGVYFGFILYIGSWPSKGRNQVLQHFGFVREKNSYGMQGEVQGVRVIISYNKIFTESESYETMITTYATKIIATHIVVGQEVKTDPPRHLKKIGVQLTQQSWHWQGKKDVMDDAENVIQLIEEMVASLLK